MANEKFSQFASGGALESGDIIVGLRAGVNTQFTSTNPEGGYTTTATAAGTTTLTVASTYLQYFTGSTTQTVALPVTSTLTLGTQFRIVNNSTGVVTVKSSGLNSIIAMATLTELTVTCILLTGTGTASWSWEYQAWQNANGNTIGSDVLVNGLTVGQGHTSGLTGTVLGASALAAITSGSENVAIGTNALKAATASTGNIVVGNSLTTATGPGASNIYIGNGIDSIAAGATGAGNVIIGDGGTNNAITSAASNVIIGQGAGNMTTGINSVIIGQGAGTSSTSLGRTVIIGQGAGTSLTSVNGNAVVIGYICATSMTGINNTIIGYGCAGTTVTGQVALTTGAENICLGLQAGFNGNASGCISIGVNTICPISTGSTSGTVGPGIALGSAAFPVGFRGDASIFPGNSGGGYWQPFINGVSYNIPLLASTTSGAVLLTSQTNTTASGIAQYLDKGTGTESSNVVTVNHQAGVITTSSLSTAAGATYTITLTNSLILSSANVIQCTLAAGSNSVGPVAVYANCTAASTAVIVLTNISLLSALSGTMLINFVIY